MSSSGASLSGNFIQSKIHFRPMFLFIPPSENMKKPEIFWFFQGYKKGTFTEAATGDVP